MKEEEEAEMTLLVDGKGDLIQRHEVLYVNGVRYLIEPVRKVSVYEHPPSIETTPETSRIILS